MKLAYCRSCRRRHIVRRHEDGRGYERRVSFTVYCPNRDATYVPMRSLANLNKWMPI